MAAKSWAPTFGKGGASGCIERAALSAPNDFRSSARVVFEGPTGPTILVLKGHDLHVLRALAAAGRRGAMPARRVEREWTISIDRLREAGLTIAAVVQPCGTPVIGRRICYVMRTPLAIEGGAYV